MFRLLFSLVCGVLLIPASFGATDIHWSSSSENTDGWILATYTNKASGVIGEFFYENKGLVNVTEAGTHSGDPYYIYYSQTGLTGNEVGFLKYDLGLSLSLFKEGEISIEYNDARTTAVLPSCILLEGWLEGTRVLLACEIPSGASQSTTITITARNFKQVTSFFYEDNPSSNPTAPPRLLTFSTGASLSEKAFEDFLSSVDSVMIRNYAWEGHSGLGLYGEEAYTYVTQLDIRPLPEPASGVLTAAGMTVLAVRRRRV